jgi:hypothetical protein
VEAGVYKAPEYDNQKVAAYQQKFAAAGVRRLRDQVQKAQTQAYDNPNSKRMVMRDALQGYGVGLDQVMAGAFGRATSAYNTEYQRSQHEAMTNFQAAESAKKANFTTAVSGWLKGGTSTSTTKNTYGGSSGGVSRYSAKNEGYKVVYGDNNQKIEVPEGAFLESTINGSYWMMPDGSRADEKAYK